MYGFITVRSASTRLPGKCHLPFGDISVLQHVIRRVRSNGIEPIVCTTTDKTDDLIVEISAVEGARYFRGSIKNKMKRWLDCAKHFGVSSFHTIDADDPYFDADLVKASIIKLKDGYDIVLPSEQSSAGAASVGYSLRTDLLENICRGLEDEVDTEMIGNFLEKMENLRSCVIEDDSKARNIRLTLDYIEDYWLLQAVRIIVGQNDDRRTVEKVFLENPDLYKINWFRNTEWKENQDRKGKYAIEEVYGTG